MAAKKFLGLGFTFAAADKGLEKKLTGIATQIERINQGLGGINGASTKASTSLGKVSKVSGKLGGASGGGGPKASTAGSAISAKAQKVSDGLSPDKMADLIGAFSGKLASGKVREAFTADAKIAVKNMSDAGDNLERIRKNLNTMLGNYAKAEEKSSLLVKNIQAVFSYTKQWFSEMKHSMIDFLSSVGISIHDLFPKELRALGGVLLSIVKPVKDGLQAVGKFLMNKLFGVVTAKRQEALLAEIRKSNKLLVVTDKQMKDNIGGSSTNTLYDAVKDLGKDLAPEKKGLLGKLKDFLLPLAIGASALLSKFLKLSWITTVVSKLFTLLKSPLKLFTKLGGLLRTFATGIGRAASILFEFIKAPTGLIRILGTVGEFLLRFIAPIAVIGTALAGFVSGLIEAKDKIFGFFKELGGLVFDIGKYLVTSLGAALAPFAGIVYGYLKEPIDWVVNAFKFVADGIKKSGAVVVELFGMLEGAVKFLFESIYKGWKLIGGAIGDLASFGQSFAKMFRSDIQLKTSEAKGQMKQDFAAGYQFSSSGTAINDRKDLLEMNNTNQKSNELSAKQNELLTEQNGLLKQMLDNQLTNGGQNVNVTIKGGKGFDVVTRGAEQKAAALRGAR